jgi:branched-chain amino acid transport system substrate-binding protein
MKPRWRTTLALLPLLLPLVLSTVAAQEKPQLVYMGLTAEFGVLGSTSAQAVEAGIKLAIAEINEEGGVLDGRLLALDARDDRSVPARGVANVRAMAQNPDLIAVFTAKLSPVALDIVPVAHELGIPLLATWSAADGIIDHGFQPSFSFRLSLRDDWAIGALLDELRVQRKFQRIGLLLPNTGWGRSSHAAARRHKKNTELVYEWYNWGERSMLPAYQRLLEHQVQAVLLVANEREGAILVKEMASLPESERLPLASHWGITGSNFVQLTGTALKAVDLTVVQTFTFNDPETPATRRVRKSALRHLGLDLDTLPSAVGFAHAYDLTHILVQALELSGSTDRGELRDALEQVQDYDGLVTDFVFQARFQTDGTLVRARKP